MYALHTGCDRPRGGVNLKYGAESTDVSLMNVTWKKNKVSDQKTNQGQYLAT